MALSETQLRFFADFIKKEVGIIYEPQNYYQLEKRLEELCAGQGVANTAELYLLAQKGIVGDLKINLLNKATNNETLFFRDPKVYTAFESLILNSLKINHPGVNLYRIWSAASSFGQEPYSIAITVNEFLQKNPGFPRFEILATDFADHAVARTKEAVYSQLEIQRGLSAPRMIKNFKKGEDDKLWILNHEIKSMVQCRKQNLLDSFAGLGQFDIIFCRYVLIYQDTAKKKEIVERLEKALCPKGFLVLGASESLMGLTEAFNMVSHEGAIFYQKK
jgi:chemotaxis protein methyltransferase CheR